MSRGNTEKIQRKYNVDTEKQACWKSYLKPFGRDGTVNLWEKKDDRLK